MFVFTELPAHCRRIFPTCSGANECRSAIWAFPSAPFFALNNLLPEFSRYFSRRYHFWTIFEILFLIIFQFKWCFLTYLLAPSHFSEPSHLMVLICHFCFWTTTTKLCIREFLRKMDFWACCLLSIIQCKCNALLIFMEHHLIPAIHVLRGSLYFGFGCRTC